MSLHSSSGAFWTADKSSSCAAMQLSHMPSDFSESMSFTNWTAPWKSSSGFDNTVRTLGPISVEKPCNARICGHVQQCESCVRQPEHGRVDCMPCQYVIEKVISHTISTCTKIGCCEAERHIIPAMKYELLSDRKSSSRVTM